MFNWFKSLFSRKKKDRNIIMICDKKKNKEFVYVGGDVENCIVISGKKVSTESTVGGFVIKRMMEMENLLIENVFYMSREAQEKKKAQMIKSIILEAEKMIAGGLDCDCTKN